MEVSFLFEQQQKRMGGALSASVLAHVAFALAVLLVLRVVPESVTTAILPDDLPREIVWLAQPGPGGGGGGGNRAPEPPKKAEAPGKDRITVPAVKEPEPTPTPEVKEEPPEEAPQLEIPAKAMAADQAATTSVGALDPNANPNSTSTGSGTGTGSGPGQGAGLGPGSGGGTGGGVYQIGNGVMTPVLVQQVRPQYTSDAMRAKIQGLVTLSCVVESDGTVTRCAVARSLDRTFGLDQEAIKAAQRWRFRPGTRMGEPVAVQVNIEMSFTLR